MRALLLRWLIMAAAFAITVALLPGLDVDWQPGTYLFLALVFGVVNAVLGTILRILTLPIMVVTFGLFALVLNGFLLVVTAWIMDSFDVDGFFAAMLGALLLSIVSTVLAVVIGPLRRGTESAAI
jgi:putative membrane protein